VRFTRVRAGDMTSHMTETKTDSAKTKAQEKDFVARLADAGEEALSRLADLPGGSRAVTAFNDLRNRVDELGRKVRGIDELETRVAKLEREVAALKRAKATPRRASSKSTKAPSSG
jgi:phage shock protein A